MKSYILILLSFIVYKVNAVELKPCENFASYYAVDAVTNELLLNGSAIHEVGILPSRPILMKNTEDEDGLKKSFEVIVTVTDNLKPLQATRYNMTMDLRDHGASCALIPDTLKVDFEN